MIESKITIIISVQTDRAAYIDKIDRIILEYHLDCQTCFNINFVQTTSNLILVTLTMKFRILKLEIMTLTVAT